MHPNAVQRLLRAGAGKGLYNTRAAALWAGVTPELLRAWERRYGVPLPKRNPSGYRLYSEEDIRAVRWIRKQTAAGLGTRQATELFKGNRLALVEPDLGALREAIVGLLLAGDREAERGAAGEGFLRAWK